MMSLVFFVPFLIMLFIYLGVPVLIAISSRTAAQIRVSGVAPLPWWCSWLVVLPLFNWVWAFVLVLWLSKLMRPALEERQAPMSVAGRSFGLTFACSQLGLFLPLGVILLYGWFRTRNDSPNPEEFFIVFFVGGVVTVVSVVLMLVFGIAYAIRLWNSERVFDVPLVSAGDVPPTDPSVFTQEDN